MLGEGFSAVWLSWGADGLNLCDELDGDHVLQAVFGAEDLAVRLGFRFASMLVLIFLGFRARGKLGFLLDTSLTFSVIFSVEVILAESKCTDWGLVSGGRRVRAPKRSFFVLSIC